MIEYGTNIHVPSSKERQLTNDLHPKWVRMDFNWCVIESSQGSFNFSQIDSTISSLNHNINIFATIAYTPMWANGGKGDAYPPNDLSDWTNFVAKCVNRYKGRINNWGIWNEPNLSQFWHGSKEDYLKKILKPAYQTIKDIDDNQNVVAADLSTMGSSSWNKWMSYLAKNQQYFDIFTYHVYSDNSKKVYERITKGNPWWGWLIPSKRPIKDYLKKIHKPLWLTEVGWDTKKCSEDEQASYYLDFDNRMKDKDYASVIIFYELSDSGDMEYGIVNIDGSKKPSYSSLQSLCLKV